MQIQRLSISPKLSKKGEGHIYETTFAPMWYGRSCQIHHWELDSNAQEI